MGYSVDSGERIVEAVLERHFAPSGTPSETVETLKPELVVRASVP